MGYGWSHSYNERIRPMENIVQLFQMDGKRVDFLSDGNVNFIAESGDRRVITATAEGGYRLVLQDGTEKYFDDDGLLIRIVDRNDNSQDILWDASMLATISDNFGRQIQLSYNENGKLETIATPVGTFSYQYDTLGNLIRVEKPDQTFVTYIYDDPIDSHNLTGIVDEIGTRTLTVTYDDQDRALTSELGGGKGRITVKYFPTVTREITDSLGNTTNFTIFEAETGEARVKTSEGAGCTNCLASLGNSYDFTDRLKIESKTDAEGNLTRFIYDDRGNILSKIEAVGTSEERTTTYTWNADYDLPLTIARQSVANSGQTAVTTFHYDASGNLDYRTESGFDTVETISSTTSFAYNSFGQITSIDGPRTDVNDIMTIEYYPNSSEQGDNRGQIWKIIDPLGHETVFGQYNAHGRPGSVVDQNCIETAYTYDTMGRPTHQLTAGAQSVMDYDGAGRLTDLHLPNGATLTYEYTPAGLLKSITDNLGNTITYAYDSEGNRVREEIADASGALRKYADYAYDANNRLETVIQPGGFEENHRYDLNDNLTEFTDAAGHSTINAYDALKRLISVTQAGSAVTDFGYDAHDNLVAVTDAEEHETRYAFDDLDRVLEEISPDAGTTRYAYDTAGNMTERTDAVGVTTIYTYDALNRLAGIHYPDASQDIIYTYDEGVNGIGRLTGMSDPSGSATYRYDALGRLTAEHRTIEEKTYTTAYGYDAAGVLTSMIYPDGRKISYAVDGAGRIVAVATTVDGVTTTLADDIAYLPFGPLRQMRLGNGTVVDHVFDLRYRLAQLSAGAYLERSYETDPVGNITAITDALDPARSQVFAYDEFYRLTGAEGIYGAIDYTYDKVGNRLTRTENGALDIYGYLPGTNRLDSVTGADPMQFAYDANGSTTTMGDKSLIYNQNNRLIQVVENAATLGEYVYNGQGQRIKKTAGGETTVFHWDQFGNVIGESDTEGNFSATYVYLGMTRLAALKTGATQNEITVHVTTDEGRTLAGIKVYAFTDSGAYTGKYAVTGPDGTAVFTSAEFADGTYKFRADVLTDRFWSPVITIPGMYSASVDIPEALTTVVVTQAGAPVSGVKVYLFNETGAYLGQYQTTDGDGQVAFMLPENQGYQFRADLLGSRYYSETVTVAADQILPVIVDTGGGILSFTLQIAENAPISGVKTYLFTETESYLGISVTTDMSGLAQYPVSSGSYKIRCDYLGKQFWSETIVLADDTSVALTLPHEDVTITVAGDNADDITPLAGVKTYLFTAAGSYQGISATTDSNGQVVFSLPASEYKVRVDYLGQQFWSASLNQNDASVIIPEGATDIWVTRLDAPLDDVPVYVFSGSGAYLGLNGRSSDVAALTFRLPSGEYNFRADYLGSQYFSGNTVLIEGQSNPVTVSTGGGNFTLTVREDVGVPITGVKCYLFSATGNYLGHQTATNAEGQAPFDLADGDYQIRIDYLGYQNWTPVFTAPADPEMVFDIPHQDIEIAVQSDDGTQSIPIGGVKTYLFTEAGSYQGIIVSTDIEGRAAYHLPANAYKIRADYLSQQYWSEVTLQEDKSITIPQGTARVQVSRGVAPIQNVKIYLFTITGAYLGQNATTDANGEAVFTLPEGSYKFRADYQGSQYWATANVTAGVDNPIILSTGGGLFALTVQSDSGAPIIDIPVYVFSTSGSYLGINARSDENGIVRFDLSDGGYQFRIDYLGYQHWSNICSVPDMHSDILILPHTNTTISVNEVYNFESDPIDGVKVYLFTASGAYQGINAITVNGQVLLTLPDRDYKVRVDYLGQQFWSDEFNGAAEVAVNIDHGYADIHVTDLGADVAGATVYLFTESGSYLGRMKTTGSTGEASFLVPTGAYKFRVDYGGALHWSDVINMISNQATPVPIALDLLALDQTLNPHPQRFDGIAPEFSPDPVYLASLLDISGILVNTIVGASPDDAVYYFINDHLGTPQKMIDTQGDIVWEADYKPFGEVDVGNETVQNRFRFPGQYFDSETGLYYNYHRYYDPENGVYLSADPVGWTGSINLYQYAFNNPILEIDPEGLEVWYKYGVSAPTDPDTVEILKQIDTAYPEYNVRVSDGLRPSSHKTCQGNYKSQHCYGKAADIKVTKGTKECFDPNSKEKDYFIDPGEVAELAKEKGATGTIYKPYLKTFRHIHIDTRTGTPYHPR